MKEYKSFEEVDRDLRILKLQNDIDKEELKLNIQQVKREISPLSLLGSLSTAVKEKALETTAMVKGAANGFIDKFKKKNISGYNNDLVVESSRYSAEPIETEVIVEKVIIDTEEPKIKGDRPMR